MKNNNLLGHANSIVALSVCIASLLISACGAKAVKQEKLSETEACNRLQGLIEDHPNQFKKYRKNYMPHKLHGSWTADKVIPSAKECQIWEWSTGLFNYACEWTAEEGKSEALANYQEASRIIQSCLGNSWAAKTNTTKSGGENTVYSRDGSPTAVSVRYFEDARGWTSEWVNTVIVGDRNNLKSPLR